MACKINTWAEQLISSPPHVDVTHKSFAGIPAGTHLLISSPAAVSALIKSQTPVGQAMRLSQPRASLATEASAQAIVPLTTGIFARIAAEAAWDELEADAKLGAVTPLWRVADPDSAMAKNSLRSEVLGAAKGCAAGSHDKAPAMTRFVIGPDVALELAERRAVIPGQHRLLAPTLLRSQVLAHLYAQVKAGGLTKKEAAKRLDYSRGLNIRLLGDRVLQQVAWAFAEQLGWPNTFVAEYVALTKLQGDAMVLCDEALSQELRGLITVASVADLLRG